MQTTRDIQPQADEVSGPEDHGLKVWDEDTANATPTLGQSWTGISPIRYTSHKKDTVPPQDILYHRCGYLVRTPLTGAANYIYEDRLNAATTIWRQAVTTSTTPKGQGQDTQGIPRSAERRHTILAKVMDFNTKYPYARVGMQIRGTKTSLSPRTCSHKECTDAAIYYHCRRVDPQSN